LPLIPRFFLPLAEVVVIRNQLLYSASALLVLLGGGLWFVSARAQGTRGGATGGDQIVDGIGETSLIARYPLDGNVNDRSRDGRNATLRMDNGQGAARPVPAFVNDNQFGRVLSLPGDSGAYLELPASALANADALSVVGWVYLNADVAEQRFFDFGKSATASIYCTPTGTDAKDGYRTRITATGTAGEQGPTGPRIATGKWVHLAVVLDGAAKTLTAYADGVKVDQTKNLAASLDQAIDQKNPEANKLYIGRAQTGGAGLNAKLHDVRLYSVALTDAQVATIQRNALGLAASAPATAAEPARTMASAAIGGGKLTGVREIRVTTIVGQLPKLPVMVPGIYENGVKGPEVRVIWPAPRNANDVQKEGTYTVTGKVPGTNVTAAATIVVTAASPAPAPARTLEAFPLGQVVLNQDAAGKDTMFIKNRNKFATTLAQTNPDNFLYMFRDAFGQPQPQGARALGGWDTQTTRLRGHASGHYLSALAQAYASSTYDPVLQANFLKRMNYMIDTLYDLSQKSGNPREPGGPANADPTKVPPVAGRPAAPAAGRRGGGGGDMGGYDSNFAAGQIRTDYENWGKGFISAYPPDQFIMLENGATYGGSNNQIWAPYYTLHKILAGLLDCYEVGGNKKALDIATGMGLWVQQRLSAVPLQTRISMWNRYIAGEYGGMNEVMARMYRLTNDQRLLDGAKLFDNVSFFFGDVNHTGGLLSNVDTLRGKHANQHIPQITGSLETFRDSRDPIYFRIADNFWDFATNDYMYAIGGVAGSRANSEAFTAEPDALWANGFNPDGQNETCATYNMLKLSRQLFMFQPDHAKYMDYYEQALYNDILASVAENNAGNTYHIPLNPGARKGFGNADMSGFTCCNGTALESNTKLQDSIYFRSADDAALYVNLYVPSTLTWTDKKAVIKQETNFPYADGTKITVTGASNIDLHVRVPDWATKGFFVKINGTEKQVPAELGSYISLGKSWKDGDMIELRMPFDFHLFRVMDQPNIASIMFGPIVLAAQETAAIQQYRPVTLDMSDLSKSITGDPAKLQFKIGDVTLKPFYESYGRYSVYFDVKPQ
jgi:uncharacterized protein